jgi:hypothetical protein
MKNAVETKSFDRDLQELRKEEEETKSAAAVEEKNQTNRTNGED